MDYKVYEDTIVLRLNRGDEVVQSINEVCIKENIKAASITGLGAADKIQIGVFKAKTKEYISNCFEGDHEITNLTGNVSEKDGQVYLHLHATFADEECRCIGGHLNKAEISVTAEIFIHKVHGFIERKMNDDIGINLIEF